MAGTLTAGAECARPKPLASSTVQPQTSKRYRQSVVVVLLSPPYSFKPGSTCELSKLLRFERVWRLCETSLATENDPRQDARLLDRRK